MGGGGACAIRSTLRCDARARKSSIRRCYERFYFQFIPSWCFDLPSLLIGIPYCLVHSLVVVDQFMAYYRDQRGQPRSVRELVQRVGRSIGATGNQSRIPTANSFNRLQENPCTSNSLRASTLEEEMGSRFPQCRGRSQYTGRSSQGDRRYNPYTYTRRTRASTTPRTPAHGGKAFTCTVFLLDQDEDTIPRGHPRQLMYEEGRVVDFVELNTAMTDDAVYTAIENIFSNILPNVQGDSKYRYVIACYF